MPIRNQPPTRGLLANIFFILAELLILFSYLALALAVYAFISNGADTYSGAVVFVCAAAAVVLFGLGIIIKRLTR